MSKRMLENVFQPVDQLIKPGDFFAGEAHAGHEGFMVQGVLADCKCFTGIAEDDLLVRE